MGVFTDDEIWTGGFYELALEYPSGTDAHLLNALTELWHAPDIVGCYLKRDVEPEAQPRLEFEASMLSCGHVQGVATLPNGTRVACGSCCVRDDDGSDWLVFYFPMSALGHAFPVGGFPFDDGSHEIWRHLLDSWLADLGRTLFRLAPYRLGLVGFETSGDLRAADVASSGVPQRRYMGVLAPSNGALEWHRRTETG